MQQGSCSVRTKQQKRRRKRILSTLHRELGLGHAGQFRRGSFGKKDESTKDACVNHVFWQVLRREKRHKRLAMVRKKRGELPGESNTTSLELVKMPEQLRGCSQEDLEKRELTAKTAAEQIGNPSLSKKRWWKRTMVVRPWSFSTTSSLIDSDFRFARPLSLQSILSSRGLPENSPSAAQAS